MNDPNISRGNVCKYLCIGRQWLRLGSDEGINRFLSHYRVELFSGVANAAISYNVVNISLSLASMELNSVQSRVMEGEILSTMIGGMIVGQIVFGGLGDLWGRKQSLAITLSICAVTSIASAFICSSRTQYQQLLALRFILGVGAGGTYPLLSVITREAAPSQKCCATMVAAVFSMQGVGYLCSPIVMLLLLAIFPRHYRPQLWRWHLGLGSIVLVLLLLIMAIYGVTEDIDVGQLKKWKSRNSILSMSISSDEEVMPMDEYSISSSRDHCSTRHTVRGPISNEGNREHLNYLQRISAIMTSSHLKIKCLIGTAGAWFLFDVCFYGTTLAIPEVLYSCFGSDRESLLKLCWQDLFLKSVALPGYFVAVRLIRIISPKRLQMIGLLGMSIVYFLMGMERNGWLLGGQTAFVVLFSLSFLFADIGPNATTYTLPTLVFHEEVRSSFSGISAAAGKVGALLGSIFFPSLTSKYDDGIVFIACAMGSIVAILVTHFLVEDWDQTGPYIHENTDSGPYIRFETEGESLRSDDSSCCKSDSELVGYSAPAPLQSVE